MNTTLDTTNWAQYPLTVNGIDFVSKVDTNGSMYKQIAVLPQGIFDSMNKGAILEIIGDPSELTYDELVLELERINEGASQAVIELAQSNCRGVAEMSDPSAIILLIKRKEKTNAINRNRNN